MDCPDLETLSRLIDRPDRDGGAGEAHARSCPDCRDRLDRLRSVDDALQDRRLWGPSEHLGRGDLLEALSGDVLPEHARTCPMCRGDLAALREVVAEAERGAAPAPSAALRARLSRLAPSTHSTIEEGPPLRALPGGRSARSSRRSGVGRVSSRRRRRSATGRVSATGRLGASRRAAVVSGRRGDGPGQPGWAWAVLSAAAAVLVALALALSSTSPGPTAPGVARTDRPTPPVERPVGPRPDPAPSPAPSPAEEAEVEPEPDYPVPLPAVDPVERPLPPPVADEAAPESVPEAAEAEPVEAEPVEAPSEVGPSQTHEPAVAQGPPTDRSDPDPSGSGAAPARGEEILDDGGQLVLARASGAVAVRPRGETTWRALSRAEGAVLRPGDRLRTRADRGALVGLDDGSDLCLDRDSELVVRGTVGGPVLGLEQGRLLAEVASLDAGERFVVATEQGTFSVLGTVFAVEAGDGAARLVVAEGAVAAANGHGSAEVPAGSALALPAAAPPGEAERVDVRRALAWADGIMPRREVLFAAGFDDGVLNGFSGDLVDEGAYGRPGRSLRFGPIDDNAYWGLRLEAAANRIRALRAAPDVYVQFSVWSEVDANVLLVTSNETQAKDFKAGYPLKAGRWRTVTVPLLDLTTYYDPGRHPMLEGDLLRGLSVLTGDPGATHRALLDEVVVFRKVYR